MRTFFDSLINITTEMSWYLLLGFFVAGLLHVFVKKKYFNKYVSGNNTRSVVAATLLGIPLPLCSCGVIPTAVSLKRKGASDGATTAFLTATPQTGVDSIAATYSLLGGPFAFLRPLAALIIGVGSGVMVNIFGKHSPAHLRRTVIRNTYGMIRQLSVAPCWRGGTSKPHRFLDTSRSTRRQ